MNAPNQPEDRTRHTRRVPANSIFYDRVFPIVLIALAIITITLILVASGVLLGIIPFR